jgi:hypothetical protein
MVVKALARDAEPDHDTIAHFISSYAAAYVLTEGAEVPGLLGGWRPGQGLPKPPGP